MSFFEQQDRARKQTGRLVVLFVVATLAIVAAVNAAAYVAASILDHGDMGEGSGLARSPEVYLLATVATLAVVGLGTLYKVSQLSAGGKVVAEMLGGRLVNPNSSNAAERRLINVVEEMAIASGVPTPPVYLLESEGSINAFAAGFSPRDAVVGVTKGCVQKLSRDELQGVIAHEFSHIMNGDMRLNIRLTGIIHGIVVLSVIGYVVLRAFFSGGSRMRVGGGSSSRRSGGKGGNGGAIILAIIAVAVLLLIIGSIGQFFGRLIQAAVSRQREYLADASAVQFTRNPRGIGGALARIAGLSTGARVSSGHASEVSHMFFGDAMGSWLSAFSTHPPIMKRIAAIDPTLAEEIKARGPWSTPDQPDAMEDRGVMLAGTGRPGLGSMAGAVAGLAGGVGAASAARRRLDPSALVASSGELTGARVASARTMLEAIPESVKSAAHEPYNARGLALALLLSREGELRERELKLIDEVDMELGVQVRRGAALAATLPSALRLPVLQLCRQALGMLTPAQGRQVLQAAKVVVESDARVTLGEFAVFRILRMSITPAPAAVVKYYSIGPLIDEVARVVMAVAMASGGDTDAEYSAGMAQVRSPQAAQKPGNVTLRQLELALDRLDDASMPVKRQVIAACASAVLLDRDVEPEEAEMLQMIAMALQAPLPATVDLASAGVG